MKDCLIIDDSVAIRTIGRAIIESLSVKVREAANGQDGLSLCRTLMPGVILLDWHMPVMNGPDFLKALHHDAHTDHPAVIVLSEQGQPQQIQNALHAGANEFILKPFDTDIIRSKFEILGFI